MSLDNKIYQILTEAEQPGYDPRSLRLSLSRAAHDTEVEFQRSDGLDSRCYEIVPGHREMRTGLLFEVADVPETPRYSNRPSRSGAGALLGIAREAGFEAVLSVGPNSIDYSTPEISHRYLTTSVEDDLSDLPHVGELTPEACSKIVSMFLTGEDTTADKQPGQSTFGDF